MMVLVRWCCNVDCNSVGRVPSSHPRCVRCPTALFRFYPIPFLFVVSVCRGGVRFGFSIPCPSSLSFWSFPLVSACTWFRFLFPLPLVFMYCILRCFVPLSFSVSVSLFCHSPPALFGLSLSFSHCFGVPRLARFVCGLPVFYFRISLYCSF